MKHAINESEGISLVVVHMMPQMVSVSNTGGWSMQIKPFQSDLEVV